MFLSSTNCFLCQKQVPSYSLHLSSQKYSCIPCSPFLTCFHPFFVGPALPAHRLTYILAILSTPSLLLSCLLLLVTLAFFTHTKFVQRAFLANIVTFHLIHNLGHCFFIESYKNYKYASVSATFIFMLR